jgi:triosephosphate isomerase
MRKKIIVGNWKMFNGPQAARQLAKSLKLKLTDIRKTTVAICPPFVSIDAAREVLKDTRIALGAQNIYLHQSGAYTGEVSAEMIKEAGCTYVIIGHSERRQYFGESDELINQKLNFAIAQDLIPIVCIGETLDQRNGSQTKEVVTRQFLGALNNISQKDAEKIVVAYEPVWAIGTGKNATAEQADEVHKLIRSLGVELYGKQFGDSLRIQYGGSVKPDNAHALLASANIDGALVGGASLDADAFAAIIRTAENIN